MGTRSAEGALGATPVQCPKCGSAIPASVAACPRCVTASSSFPEGVRLVLSKGPKETDVILGNMRTMMDLATSGRDLQTTYPINRDETKIGRAPGSDIQLNHPTVSKLHARIVLRADGFWITDEDSSNGVQVNGKEIRNQRLASRDTIKIGNFSFFFLDPNDPEE